MSSLFLTNTSMAADTPSGAETTRHKLDIAAGAAATIRNKNSVAGPTAPLKVTDSAVQGTDGNAIAWYSDPIQAITIAGQIICRLWTRENATANNVAPSVGIYRCSAAGAELATIVDPTTNLGGGEMATTAAGASDTITITAANVTDTAIAEGERIKVALFIDDASGQGGTGTMASGGRGVFWVNGPVGAQGQSEIVFAEVIAMVGAVFRARSPLVVQRESLRRHSRRF